MSSTASDIINIAICGHGGTGKTTLTEFILFNGGIIPKTESVEKGQTVSDFTEEENAKKISIHTALGHINWNKKKFNILDTPGSSDFVGEVASAFRVAESALVLIGADVGVQIETVKIWRRLNSRNMPRFIFVNKMDKEHADFSKAADDVTDKFKSANVALTIPMGSGASYKGVIDLIHEKAYTYGNEGKETEQDGIPDEFKAQAEENRQKLIETAAEGDDALIEKYFDEGTLSVEEIVEGLKKGLKQNKVVPVFAGAANLGSGINAMLSILSEIAPEPSGEEPAQTTDGQDISVKYDINEPFSAFVFKTTIDQFTGKLSLVKVISGKATPDSELLNVKADKKEKVSKIYTLQGKKIEEMEELTAGDIGCFAKLSSVNTNDSLCAPEKPVVFPPLKVPQPVHSLALSAKSKKDEDKLNQLLIRAAEEDLTFKLHFNPETKENVISGMGEQHISIILDKIKEKQKIDIETRVPKVAYRETITASAGAEYLHKKQTGGHGQYAKVVIEIKPLPRGEKFKFVNAIFGGAISRGYIPGVEKGILEGMEAGYLAGYPIVDVEAKVVDGKEHPVDSSELAFKLAAREALKASVAKAKPVLLEPVMNLSVYVDDQYLGDVLSDLSSRRGRVLGQEPIGGGIQVIKAQVPQSELLRYSIDLRSITSGTASFEMEFSHYSPITGKVADDVIKAAKAAKEQS
ncbi:MAG: elongation factor G [Spirochaetes bacterium]|nr:MAG: elongation factor G [Spirochaetota bacterium]